MIASELEVPNVTFIDQRQHVTYKKSRDYGISKVQKGESSQAGELNEEKKKKGKVVKTKKQKKTVEERVKKSAKEENEETEESEEVDDEKMVARRRWRDGGRRQ